MFYYINNINVKLIVSFIAWWHGRRECRLGNVSREFAYGFWSGFRQKHLVALTHAKNNLFHNILVHFTRIVANVLYLNSSGEFARVVAEGVVTDASSSRPRLRPNAFGMDFCCSKLLFWRCLEFFYCRNLFAWFFSNQRAKNIGRGSGSLRSLSTKLCAVYETCPMTRSKQRRRSKRCAKFFLNTFGEFIRSDRECGNMTAGVLEPVGSSGHLCAPLFSAIVLNLCQIVWRQLCHHLTRQQKT